jgi:hypothetical protein
MRSVSQSSLAGNVADMGAQPALPSVLTVTAETTAETTALLRPCEDGLHELDLTGVFAHPHWLAFLCGGLAAAGVSVVSGQARRDSPLRWQGRLVLDGRGATTPVTDLDVVALAGTRPMIRDIGSPALTSFQIRRRLDGQLDLQVDAPDELGFLGRLLRRVALLTLVPTEIEIATVRGTIQDRVVLGGIGTAPPSDEVLASLREMLTALT